MIKFVEGDLIEMFENGEFDACCQQVNAQNIHGGGIAKGFSEKYPQIYNKGSQYKKNIHFFGKYYTLEPEEGIIYNLISQWYLGAPSNHFIDTDYTFQYGLIKDDFAVRLKCLKNALNLMFYDLSPQSHRFQTGEYPYKEKVKVLCPLLASGLAKQLEFKRLSDLEYFERFILPTIEEVISEYPNIELTIVNYVK